MKNIWILAAVVFAVLPTSAFAGDPVLTESDLIYTPEQMLGFNIDAYLTTHAPHLSPHAKSISHWAGFSSISPKILIALMEHQTSIVSIRKEEAMLRPFASLSEKEGFNEQVKDIANRLAKLHYEHDDPQKTTLSIVQLLLSGSPRQSASSDNISAMSESFFRTYFRLFPVESR